MKNSQRVALGGCMAALSATIMLASYFPYLTFAVPAIAGLCTVVTLIEIDRKWAFFTFAAATVVVLLTAEPEAKVLYTVFFGYYPIVKATAERLGNRVAEYVIKFVCFNAAMAAYVLAAVYVVGIPATEFTESDLGKYSVPVMIALGNVVFFVYDVALTRVITRYVDKLHEKIKRLIK